MNRSLCEEGIRLFNEARYWHAHEAWEQVWRKLEGSRRTHLQSLIQACGSFHLHSIGRTEAAARMAQVALDKLRQGPGDIDVPGLEAVLLRAAAGGPESTKDTLAQAARLRATLRTTA